MCKSWYSIGICIGIKSGKSNPDPNRHKHDADPQNWWILLFLSEPPRILKETKKTGPEPESAVVYWWFDLLLSSIFFIYVISTPQDPMKRPTFETLQWKLEDFFTMSDSEYKDASAY